MKKMEPSLVSKLFWNIMPVQMLICSIGAVNSLIDGVIGSRFLGAEAMAAVGLFGPVSTIIGGITSVICVGATIMITTYMGKTQKESAGRIFSVVGIMVGLFTIVCSTALIVFAKPLAVLLGGNNGNTLLSDYIIGISIFLVFQMLSSYFMNGLQIICKTGKAYAALAVMGVSNALMDIFFVCVFKMGIFGLGLATGISFLLQALFILPTFLGNSSPLQFCRCQVTKDEFVQIIRGGLPTALGSISMSLKGFILNGLLLQIGGTLAVAALSVENTYCWFLGSVTTGVSQAVLFLMSLYISEEDKDSLGEVYDISVKTSLAIGFGIAIIMSVLAKPFAALFYANDPDTLALTTSSIRIFPWFLPFNILVFSLIRMYQAQNKTVITYIFSFAENLVVAGCSFGLVHLFGTDGIWAALPVADALLLIVMLVYVWIANKKVTFNSYDVMLLDKNFGVSDENRMSKTIYSLNDGINISKDVIDFCERHSIDHKVSNISGLCVEEISILLFHNAFNKVKDPQVDVRLIKKGDTLTIRLRNNGQSLFNGEKLKMDDSDDPCANVGIKLLQKLTEDINCNSILGLNVITIRLKLS